MIKKIKPMLKEGIKNLFPITIFSTFIFSSIKYFVRYYEEYNLNFTPEDKFLFVFTISITIIFTFFSIYIFWDRKKLLKKIEDLKIQLEDSEDNFIWVNRDTQEMFLNHFKDDNEKR